MAWAADNKTLFLTTEDDVTKRSDKLFRHVLGSPAFDLLYDEKDELYDIEIGKTRDRKYLVLEIESKDTSEARYLSAARPQDNFAVFLPREKKHRYYVDHREGTFYIRTNQSGINFAIMTAPENDPARKNWKVFLAHRDDVRIDDIDLFQDFAVSVEKSQALAHLRVHNFKTGTWTAIAFPEPVYSVFPGGTPEYESTTYRYNYQSLITPSSIFDYDTRSGKSTLLKQQEVLGGYDPKQYASERLWATARDGVKVPISIVYKKGIVRDGKAPLFLYGYGSYGIGTPPTFSSQRLSLLDRGMSYAIAHIRGGDEMGEKWREDGMLMKKKNTFFDFIDCAEFLIKEKWTSSRPPGDRRRQRGRPADGRRGQPAPRSVPRRALRRPVRRRDEHHDGRHAPADRRRVPGVGQPQREGGVRLHEDLQPLRQSGEARLSGDAGHHQLQRQPGDVLGARQIRRPPAHREDGQQPAAPEDQDGPRRTRRRLRPLRPPERSGLRVRLDAVAGRNHEVTTV